MAEQPVYELTEEDIPGASLREPLEGVTVHALRWWLQCRDIQVPSSLKKAQIIERVRKAKAEGVKVVDVDGSYLYRKYHTSISDPDSLPLPCAPAIGWDVIDSPDSPVIKNVPKVTHGLLYTYLADSVGRSGRGEAFRALERGYTHWSSGRLAKIEVNINHPLFCHIRCHMAPSMKQGVYRIYILLGREGEFATISAATCDCAAGKSASCTHISALLHALTSLHPTSTGQSLPSQSHDEESALPVTSYLCQWNAPRKRKETNLPISEAVFHKHVYGRQRKYELKEMANFDPRPPNFRGNTKTQLNTYLDSVRGQGIGVSLLFDEQCQCWSDTPDQSTPQSLPSKTVIQERVKHFKESLNLPQQKLREIEQSTRDQAKSLLWYSVRRYRITASLFGAVFHRKPDTPPHCLVLQMLGKKPFTSAATSWGKHNEAKALQQYQHFQRSSGYDVSCSPSGFVIDDENPFLGASPDAVVYDPSESNSFGLVEIKCPYSSRNLTPLQAADSDTFCCTSGVNPSGDKILLLKKSHNYYCQIQGQMGITKRTWCDFVVYTEKGLSVERVQYDAEFWKNYLLPKLATFYDNCLAPEIVCPVHVLGMSVRNLEKL